MEIFTHQLKGRRREAEHEIPIHVRIHAHERVGLLIDVLHTLYRLVDRSLYRLVSVTVTLDDDANVCAACWLCCCAVGGGWQGGRVRRGVVNDPVVCQ